MWPLHVTFIHSISPLDKSSDLKWSFKLRIWSNHTEHPKGLAQFRYTRYPLLQDDINLLGRYKYIVDDISDEAIRIEAEVKIKIGY